MRNRRGQFGFTLLEIMVTLATVLILISAMLGLGHYVKTQADIRLTEGLLETLSTALTQYYDDTGGFPFVTQKDYTGDSIIDPYNESHMEYDLNGVVVPADAIESLDIAAASSAALFYFLDQIPASRAIAEAVSSSLVSNTDDNSTIAIKFRPAGGAADGSDDIDLPRYIDPWGTSIRYEYLTGAAFPVLTSAGPDKVFDTPDDITSQ